MKCDEVRPLIHPYVDGELDLVRAMAIDWHLEDCAACGQMRDQIAAVRGALCGASLRYSAPEGLAQRIREVVSTGDENVSAGRNIAAPRPHHGVRATWRWVGVAALAAAVLICCAVWMVRPGGSAGEMVVQQILANHVRSLLAEHLFDVASTNQHTVKPWFSGKLDFSPPVEDLADAGFPLKGGRLDVLGDQTVAALVYQRRQHVINLFVWPDTTFAVLPAATQWHGYHLRSWNANGMVFCAVSDLGAAELQEFTKLLGDRLAAARSN